MKTMSFAYNLLNPICIELHLRIKWQFLVGKFKLPHTMQTENIYIYMAININIVAGCYCVECTFTFLGVTPTEKWGKNNSFLVVVDFFWTLNRIMPLSTITNASTQPPWKKRQQLHCELNSSTDVRRWNCIKKLQRETNRTNFSIGTRH